MSESRPPLSDSALSFADRLLALPVLTGRPLRESHGYFRDLGLALFRRDHDWFIGVEPFSFLNHVALLSGLTVVRSGAVDHVGALLSAHPGFAGAASECSARYGGDWVAVRVHVNARRVVRVTPAQQELFDLTDDQMRALRLRYGFAH